MLSYPTRRPVRARHFELAPACASLAFSRFVSRGRYPRGSILPRFLSPRATFPPPLSRSRSLVRSLSFSRGSICSLSTRVVRVCECVHEVKWLVCAQSSMQTTLLLLVDSCITASSAPMVKACDLVTKYIKRFQKITGEAFLISNSKIMQKIV